MTNADLTLEATMSTTADPWTRVCVLDDLEPLWGEAALVGSRQVALFLLPDGRVHAVSNADPATGAFVMSRGIVGSRGDRPTIASPLHKDVFDLATGQCFTNPELRLPVWPVEVVDGAVSVCAPPALVAISHGTSDARGQASVSALVDAVRAHRPDLHVEHGCVDVQQPDVPAALGATGSGTPAVIVPLLLSSGYHVHVDLRREAAARCDRSVQVTRALGPDTRLAALLRIRLDEVGLRAGDSVVLAAAGSSDPAAVDDCLRMGRMLQEVIDAPVTVGFISASHPPLEEAIATARAADPTARVVLATYLLAAGYFAGIAEASSADVVSAPLLDPLQPPPRELVEIVSDLFEASARTTIPFPTKGNR